MASKINFPGFLAKYERMFSKMELEKLQRAAVGTSEEFFQHVAVLRHEKRSLGKCTTSGSNIGWYKEVISTTRSTRFMARISEITSHASTVGRRGNSKWKNLATSFCSYAAVKDEKALLFKMSISRPGHKLSYPVLAENHNELSRYTGLNRRTRFPDKSVWEAEYHRELTDLAPEGLVYNHRTRSNRNSYTGGLSPYLQF